LIMLIRSRRTSDNQKIKHLLLIVVGLFVFALVVPSVVRFAAGIILYPVIQVENWFAESNQVLPTLWRDKIAMQDQIDQLEQDLALSGKLDLTQRRLFAENNRLRSLLGATSSPRILAAVVGKPDELPYDLIQIDQGGRAGIEAGSPVYIGQDTVIGLVSAVQSNSAFVTLFTTPDFFATVYLSGANVTALLEGLGGGVARVRVPQGVPIRVGDLVHVPSIQPGVYGKIAWVESEPTQPEQFGYITPEIPISSLFQVAVARSSVISTDPEKARQYMLEMQNQMLVIPGITPATSTATSTSATGTADQL
jgi:cell shape-determining protein MreC